MGFVPRHPQARQLGSGHSGHAPGSRLSSGDTCWFDWYGACIDTCRAARQAGVINGVFLILLLGQPIEDFHRVHGRHYLTLFVYEVSLIITDQLHTVRDRKAKPLIYTD